MKKKEKRGPTKSSRSSYGDGDVGSVSDSDEGEEGSEDGEGSEHLLGTGKGEREVECVWLVREF